LIDSGKGYVSGLQAIFETESKKRSEEKAQIAGEKEQVRTGLTAEIESLQQQITTLQAKMDSQQQKLLMLDETYNPRLKEIEQKIKTGSDAVNSVLHEMQQVLQIIEKDIN
jgi:predicted  nucleic acid-binding Zn-ribbon protein